MHDETILIPQDFRPSESDQLRRAPETTVAGQRQDQLELRIGNSNQLLCQFACDFEVSPAKLSDVRDKCLSTLTTSSPSEVCAIHCELIEGTCRRSAGSATTARRTGRGGKILPAVRQGTA